MVAENQKNRAPVVNLVNFSRVLFWMVYIFIEVDQEGRYELEGRKGLNKMALQNIEDIFGKKAAMAGWGKVKKS